MTEHLDDDAPRWSARAKVSKVSFVVFAVIGAFFLAMDHRAHLLAYVPWLFLLACPLMHFFHHEHGGHAARNKAEGAANPSPPGSDGRNEPGSPTSAHGRGGAR